LTLRGGPRAGDHVAASAAALSLSPEEMRAFGYRVVDALVADHERLAQLRVTPTGAPPSPRFDASIPETGAPAIDVLGDSLDAAFGDVTRQSHPRYFAKIPAPGNFVSAMADALVSGLNVFAATAKSAPGPTRMEVAILRWLCAQCGLPAGAGGALTSGGSAANLIALAAARHRVLGDDLRDATLYGSVRTHASIERAARVLGIDRDGLRSIEVDADGAIDVDALAGAVRSDRAAGRRPFCVVANAGTTDVGAVDDLEGVARLCGAERLWLHVDGAYGAAAVLTERGRRALRGLDLADSVTLDPHKWLFQPLEVGAILARDPAALADVFRVDCRILRDIEDAADVDFKDLGLQLSRSAKALKLWMSLRVFGANAFRDAIDRGMDLAEIAEQEARRCGGEVVTPARLGIVTFRFAMAGGAAGDVDRLQLTAAEQLARDGFAAVDAISVGGRVVLRMCTINPRASEEDVRAVVRSLRDRALARG
jgi:glutamate/tyrosine decarboxylase-like PLP-dependent enzyme